MEAISPNDSSNSQLLSRARHGDQKAIGQLLEKYRGRLRRVIRLRLDRRLQARLDPSDILQEAYLDALRRLDAYLAKPTMPFYLWLRFLVCQKLHALHGHHFSAKKRDARREVRIVHGAAPEATSEAIAALALRSTSTPSEKAERAGKRALIVKALSRMEGMDREVLAMRHFEELTNAETAQVLGIKPSAASKRYLRAAKRLKEILSGTAISPEEEGS